MVIWHLINDVCTKIMEIYISIVKISKVTLWRISLVSACCVMLFIDILYT